MKYIKVEKVTGSWGGFSLNADDYLAILPDICNDLPEGARKFAEDVDRYNFFGPRCVKDLKFDQVVTRKRDDRLVAEFSFSPNHLKHDQGLMVRYDSIVEVLITASDVDLGAVQLDEILPHEHGFSHEIQLTGGKIWIVGEDMAAQWVS